MLGNPPKHQLHPLIALGESFGRPSALDYYPRRGARVAVDRPLELRLEEHIVRLPPGGRRTLRLKPQEQVTVGAEPPVVVNRNHLFGQHFGETERLQQPHDLVIDVNGARETIGLSEALEYRDPVTGSSEHRRQRLPYRPVADDRNIEVRLVDVIDPHPRLHGCQPPSIPMISINLILVSCRS